MMITKIPTYLGILGLILGTLVGTSCNNTVLSADNYWTGAEQEVAYVQRTRAPGALDLATTPATAENLPPPPVRKADGSKFRLEVVISGEYWEFFDSLKGLIEGFSSIGWAKSVNIPASVVNTEQLIQWISRQDYSEWVEFSPELFHNLAWGENSESVEAALMANKGKADLVIAYGGMAGRLFYKYDSYPLPVIADAITDPFAAGVTQSETDSGKDFFNTRIDTGIFRKQVSLFHDLVGFKKLGIVYGDDDYGRIYGAVRDVEDVAKERGFEIVRNTNVKEEMADDTVELYLEALRDVASKSDAVYIGASTAVTEYAILPQIVAILDEAKIPSFALEGSIRVKDGLLYSLSSSGLIRAGIHTATKIARVFSGASPRSLEQRFESVPAVAVNLETAERIGYKVPLNILVNSDEVFINRDGRGPVLQRTSSSSFSGFLDYSRQGLVASGNYMPKKRSDGEPFRIAILQSGTYWEFFDHFKGLILGLSAQGWAQGSINIPPEADTIEAILDNLGSFSDYVSFPKELNLVLDWGSNTAQAERIIANPEAYGVDLFFALGGVAAGLFDSYKTYPVPVVMDAITDPIGSGFIYSVEDSGRDFVTARIDPSQFQRQIQLFHQMTGFKRLGLVYGDNDYGRLYGAVNDIELMSRRLGFSIVAATNVKEYLDSDTPDLYLNAVRSLAGRVDAVYLGASHGLTEYDTVGDVAKILNQAKLPSFALEGEVRVREGILLGVSSLESRKFGIYNAKKMAAIFHGVAPRLLDQRLEGVPSVAINLDSAKAIGFNVPLATLAGIDSIYFSEKGGTE